MTGSATEWVWANSRAANGSLIVLLAIADEIDKDGKAEMSVAELARKARLSDRGVQLATPVLVALGELEVEMRVADGNRNRYRMPMLDYGRTGEESAPVKNLQGEESAPVQNGHHAKPQVTTGEKSAPVSSFRDVLDLGSVVSGSSRSKHSSPKPTRSEPEPPRDDVDRVCAHLASRLAAWKTRRPAITQEWRDSARLMIDKDGISEQRIIAAIDWSQSGWWRTRIASMPKLREKFDVLREQAAEEQRKKTQPNGARQNPDDDYRAAMERIQARKENANGTRGNGHDSAPRQVSLPPAAD